MRKTIFDLQRMKDAHERIVMLTAYDTPSAIIAERAGVDAILVGNSLGMVVHGHETTLPVTLGDMARHTAAVMRGSQTALVVADLPFLTYGTEAEAIASARQLMQEGGAQAVKLEGGVAMAPIVARLTECGVPVMGHIGFTPQAQHQIGLRVQGRDAAGAEQLLADAQALQDAGTFALVLELLPAPLAGEITGRLRIPTIGIGAGPACGGQVQVWHDLLGLTPGHTPRHAKRFAEIGAAMTEAIGRYTAEVRGGQFPAEAKSRKIAPEGQAQEYPERAMKQIGTIAEFRAARAGFPVLGLVPTMGFLHAGHLSLVAQARRECGVVAVSIFVNPTQFAATEDLARYPRDMARDLGMLEEAGTDLVFTPAPEVMYPRGFATSVTVGPIAEVLEGATRPGHFAGVATVVAKLLNIVRPDRAYFGQKDGQQCAVIRQLVRDLDMPVEVVVGETVREADGLAMSSRNVYLNPAERAAAPVVFRALQAAAALFQAGERSGEALRAAMRAVIAAEPLAVLDYASIADCESLQELERVGPSALASIALRLGTTRLIDNLILR